MKVLSVKSHQGKMYSIVEEKLGGETYYSICVEYELSLSNDKVWKYIKGAGPWKDLSRAEKYFDDIGVKDSKPKYINTTAEEKQQTSATTQGKQSMTKATASTTKKTQKINNQTGILKTVRKEKVARIHWMKRIGHRSFQQIANDESVMLSEKTVRKIWNTIKDN